MQPDDKEIIALCPDCATGILLEAEAEKGQNITCPECWAYLKIISLDPPELGWDIDDFEEDERDQEEDLTSKS